ncbi:MAG: SLBB domain-containing protein, partial [bacterium]
MNRFIVFSLLLVIVPRVFPQSREQLKTQAESQLREMTPEEIDRKLKEYGVSREEAIRRASALNISLEQYLQKPVAGTSEKQPAPAVAAPATPVPATPGETSVRLPVQAITLYKVPGISEGRGVDDLQPFGMEIFQSPSSAFDVVLNLASPPSYLLGPSDEIVITVWGETKLNYQLQINREGNVIVPDVGPVNANGSTLAQFKQRLQNRMASIYSGLEGRYGKPNTFLDVSLGKIRTLQIFVLGEVVKPGGYAISSFATAFNALYLSGGPTINGTMRNVQIVRKGEEIPPIDLYDYIIRGDNSKDVRLQDGDIVFVKPVGRRVAIAGGVARPAIYEVKEKESLGDLLTLAGGLRFDAYVDRVHIERVIPFNERDKYKKNLLDIDLPFTTEGELLRSPYTLQDGDVIRIFKVTNLAQNRVTISGNVNKPGQFELHPGMRIRDLILAADSLQRNTFSERGTLFRLLPTLRREVHSFNPRQALEGNEADNMILQNEDNIIIYQESQFYPQQNVTIAGAVRNPGTFPRDQNLTVADLVVIAGGLTDAASLQGWEISRLDTTELGVFNKITSIDVTPAYWNAENGQQFQLADNDFVFVPSDPRYSRKQFVHIEGYVMNPGVFAIRYEGERLSEIIKRAGGIRPGGYLPGSRFVRRQKSTGVIPIDFETALHDTSSRDNLIVKADDSVHVAAPEAVVYVSGEVFVPTA